MDVVRDMGADIIIVAAVGWDSKGAAELDNSVDILLQSYRIIHESQMTVNMKDVDVINYTTLERYMGVNFSSTRIADIIRAGAVTASRNLSDLQDLKKTHKLNRFPEALLDSLTVYDNRKYYSVSITGNTTIPFSGIYSQLGIYPDDPLVPDRLLTRISALRMSGKYDRVDFHLNEKNDEYVRLFVDVNDRKPAQIYGVRIRGNNKLSFSFIYRLLGIKYFRLTGQRQSDHI